MKKNRIAQLLAVMLCAMLLLTSVGCKTSTPAQTTEEQPAATEAPVAVLPDVPADRYDATVTPRTGNNATMPLVVSSQTLDGKFSPFFASSGYDTTVEGMTQLGLLYLDKKGAPQAGVEFPCLAYSYTQQVSDDKSTSTYKFFLKNGITFSDGTPITAKDVLFTIYTLCDPLYDGSSTFYALKVQGLSEYRLQTSADALAVADAIIAAGLSTAEDKTMVMPAADGATAEQQTAFWAYLDQAGEKFTQEIVDYVSNNYMSDDYVQGYFSPDLTAEQIKASPFLTVAYGMGMWGYGAYADGKFTDALGNVYDETTGLTVADYWKNILTTYGYDLSDGGINREKAGDKRIEDYVKDLYIANEGKVAGGVASISGITTGTETNEDGVDQSCPTNPRHPASSRASSGSGRLRASATRPEGSFAASRSKRSPSASPPASKSPQAVSAARRSSSSTQRGSVQAHVQVEHLDRVTRFFGDHFKQSGGGLGGVGSGRGSGRRGNNGGRSMGGGGAGTAFQEFHHLAEGLERAQVLGLDRS